MSWTVATVLCLLVVVLPQVAATRTCYYACDKGSFCPAYSSNCQQCAAGTYAARANDVSCQDCPHGRHSPKDGAKE
jgi:hypothetical protein